MAESTSPPPKPLELVFSQRLEGFDETWESLMPLFEELQLYSADVANPTLDLLTFAHAAHYFSVIQLKKAEIEAEQASTQHEGSLWDEPSSSSSGTRTQGVSFSGIKGEDEVEGGSATVPGRTGWLTEHEDKNGIPIGLVYLQSSQTMDDYQRSGELNVGVLITEKYRGKGYGRRAVHHAFNVAFRDPVCHRVQALLIDSHFKDKALSLFMKTGMGHEGIRRRGFRSPWDYELKDVTYLGLLATDWLVRGPMFKSSNSWAPAPKSLWDELFARHQREREELLRWEEKRSLKRTNSVETIKQATAGAMSDIDDDSSFAGGDDDVESVRAGSVASTSSSSLSSAFSKVSVESPRKRRRTSQESEGTCGSWSRGGSVPPSSHGSDLSDYLFDDAEEPMDGPLGDLLTPPRSHIQHWLAESSGSGINDAHRGRSPAFSEDSDLAEISDGYATSTSSRWDVIETEGPELR